MIAIMSFWHDRVAGEGVDAVSYFDDRTIIATGPAVGTALNEAMRKSEEFDELTGAKLNLGKCQLGITKYDPFGRVDEEHWSVSIRRYEKVKLLGLYYDMEKGRPVELHDDIKIRNAERRARRINVAARNHMHKRIHISSLLISVSTWATPFAMPSKKFALTVNNGALRAFVPGVTTTSTTLLTRMVGIDGMDVQSRCLARGMRCWGRWCLKKNYAGIWRKFAFAIALSLLRGHQS